MLDPIHLGLVKPIATISSSPDTNILPIGHYYYFPYYGDTRIYLQSLDYSTHKLFIENYEDLQHLTHFLESQQAPTHGIINLHTVLSKYAEHLKKSNE